MDIQQRVENCTANKENVAKVIQEFGEIIRNKKSEIVWLAYYQVKYFRSSDQKNDLLRIWTHRCCSIIKRKQT